MERSVDESAHLLRTLRTQLRREGWTAPRIATYFGIGEATAKRWLAGRGLTLKKFGALAGLCDLTLAELARIAERPPAGLTQELTLAQERALTTNPFLSFVFIAILGGHSAAELIADFSIPEAEMESALGILVRLALIDRLPGGRVRPLVDRNIIWRKTPMRMQFEKHMKRQFLEMDFAADEAVYTSEVLKLSEQGAATLAEMIEKHRRDVQALAEQDRLHAHLPRSWYAMLCAARPLDTSALRGPAGE